MVGIVDAAVARFSEAGERLGYGPGKRVVDTERVLGQVERAAVAVEPLRLPAELLYFWTTWDVGSFEVLELLDVHLNSPGHAVLTRNHFIAMEFPQIFMPLGGRQYVEFALELDSPSVDGGRLFDLSSHAESYQVGRGIADMFDLLTEALPEDRDNADDDEGGLFPVLGRAADRIGRVEVHYDRGLWPLHWLEAEGFDGEWLEPKGATHSIAEFEAERENGSVVRAVLQGTWCTRAGIGGNDMITLTDHSGSIELRVPTDIPHAGLGPDRQCEIEVESTGRPERPASLPPVTKPGVTSAEEWARRITFDAVKHDPSITVLAVRPVDGQS